MSLWHIAWRYMWDKKLTTCLTILSVAMAVGLISAVLTLRDETRERFEEEQLVYDLVVGPSQASPLQLIMNAVYYIDRGVPTIDYSIYEAIKQHEDVIEAFPIALGDTFKSYRIVGTVSALFEFAWEHPSTGVKRYPMKKFADGRVFESGMEAVVGFRPARDFGLKVGDTFTGTHGGGLPGDTDDHEDDVYTVVGVLGPTGTSADRAIFVPLESVWSTHAHDDEDEEEAEEPQVTAVLLELYSPAVRYSVTTDMIETYGVTAAVPQDQILVLYNQIIRPIIAILMGVGYIIVVISALSILIGLYLSIIQRRRDLAIMRALGASAPEIFGAVLIEAFLVTMMGIAGGWVIGKGAALALGTYITQTYGLAIAGAGTSGDELRFFAIVAFVGMIAGILPAWQAYRVDVAQDLAAN